MVPGVLFARRSGDTFASRLTIGISCRERELNAVIGQHGVDFVGDRFDKGCQEGRRGHAVCFFSELGEGEFAGPVDGHEEEELSLRGLDLGDVDMEEADRVCLERFLGRLVAFGIRQPADAVALIAAVQGRARQVRDGGLQGIKTIVERQKRVLAEGHGDGLVLDRQDSRTRVFWPHRRVVDEGPLLPFRNRLGRSASSLAVAFDRCIAARTACVVVALP